jgi:hypothetical protein
MTTLAAKPLEAVSASRDDSRLIAELREQVQRNASRWKRLIILEALGLSVAAPLAYLWLVFLLDNLLFLPVWARGLASLGLCASLVWLAIGLVRRWRQLHFTEDQVALAMEQRSGGVQNRLINAIQLSRIVDPEQAQMSRAVVRENYARLKQIELQQAAQLKPAVLRVSAAATLIAIGVIFWFWRPAHFSNAASRILLPFANIDPLYRTILTVEPGNVIGAGDITIQVTIKGERPETLAILKSGKAGKSTEVIPVDADVATVSYTFKNVEQSLSYAVRGNDYTTQYFRIEVPSVAQLSLVRATFHYPEYTHLPSRTTESAGGDLEALLGTRAEVTFVFDHPAEEASLLLHKLGGREPERVSLTRQSPTEYSTEFTFRDLAGYQIETRREGRAPHTSNAYSVRSLADQDPKLELSGLERQTEAAPDATLPLKITASDDYGLEQVGLFFRKANADVDKLPDEGWKPVEVWPGAGKPEFRRNHDLNLSALGVAEGDKIEVVLRGRDADPAKGNRWASGMVFRFLIGGEGVALQVLYEQILQTEAEIKAVIAGEQAAMAKAADWIKKLDPSSGLRWDDKKNLDDLAATLKEQAKEQEQLRQKAAASARAMVVPAGSLRLSLGMLADTEMIRAIRILESVAGRDQVQLKRSTLADARLTQERTIRSLQEILENYVTFRQEWELGNMIPYTRMIADRQAALRDEARAQAARPMAAAQASMAKRQLKLVELCGLAKVAFAGMAERNKSLDALLIAAFVDAAKELAAPLLLTSMNQGAEAAKTGQWPDAATHQAKAAEILGTLAAKLRKAQTDAALRALAALKEKAKSDVEAQKAIEKLKAGNSDKFIDDNVTDKLKLEDIIHMQEAAQNKNAKKGDDVTQDYLFTEAMKSILQQPDSGMRQEFAALKLAKSPTGEPSYPNQTDRIGNKVKPHIQEKFDDLVGKLLEEADIMKDKYETYNLNAAFNINEPGDIGKQAGDLNSTAASAATGNMKPPSNNVGGASRAGRRGARAHGMVVGDESINRRGRDKVQEGQERVGDQAGTIREKKSEDMQADTSTGVGGKKVESDDPNKFSTADVGKFTDDMANRMDKPQAKNMIVERAGGKMDPRVAEMMKDLDAKQEQLIERVKAVRKELRNLYLPTEHLDELVNELKANLDSLKDRPKSELFRAQQQALDKLRSAVRVFHQAHAGFQPSVAREQVVQGRILDEPARQTLPGYEDAVKQYYEKLSNR